MSHTSFAIAARELNHPRSSVWFYERARGAALDEIDHIAAETGGA